MYSQTKIAIPILREDKASILEEAEKSIIRGADLIELRIDGIKNPTPELVSEIIDEINFPTIATNRLEAEGGFFKGSEEERIGILEEAAKKADYVDIELQTKKEDIEKITSKKAKSIISYHNFNKTPSLDEILEIINKEKELGDIAKVALMPNSLEDTLTVLTVLSYCEDTIAISMGDIGSYTRVIASKFNAPITFAVSNDTTAPGQIDIETMKLLLHNDLIELDSLKQ